MNKEQFRREKEYGVALYIAKTLLAHRLITASEYRKATAELIRLYQPVIGAAPDAWSGNSPQNG